MKTPHSDRSFLKGFWTVTTTQWQEQLVKKNSTFTFTRVVTPSPLYPTPTHLGLSVR